MSNILEFFSKKKTMAKPNDDFEEYSASEGDMRKHIGGHLSKRFVRYRSDFFPDLVSSIKNKDSSYDTYVNDLISECCQDTDTLPMERLSVLRKLQVNDVNRNSAYNEYLGSKVANMFGLKTVYNKWCKKEGSSTLHTLSVDFMKPGDRFKTLE